MIIGYWSIPDSYRDGKGLVFGYLIYIRHRIPITQQRIWFYTLVYAL